MNATWTWEAVGVVCCLAGFIVPICLALLPGVVWEVNTRWFRVSRDPIDVLIFEFPNPRYTTAPKPRGKRPRS